MTTVGGSANRGTIYKITSAGSLTIYHSFGDGSVTNDGSSPQGNLFVASDGNLYGTTVSGGSANKGVVFKMTPAGVVTTLHSFGDGSVTNDGAFPNWFLIQGSDGNLYGTTVAGGGTPDKGVIFKMTLSGTLTILHRFGDGTVANDGVNPVNVVQSSLDGNFYGTTNFGGAYAFGTLFRMTPSGTLTVLHAFGDLGSDGQFPGPLMESSKGRLFGQTQYGGNSATSGKGTIFTLSVLGDYRILHVFGDGTVTNDGASPRPTSTLWEGTDHLLYGTTPYGGSANHGVAFKFDPTTFVTMHNFMDGSTTNDGQYPNSKLIFAQDGNFYGVSSIGGSANKGALFKMSPTGVVSTMHSFNDGSVSGDGEYPSAPVLQLSNGFFYGLTNSGGTNNCGIAYKMNTSGTFTVLHAFTSAEGCSRSGESSAGFTLNTDGSLYGVRAYGGTYNKGTIFKLASNGTVTVLHHFGSVTNDGDWPAGKLLLASDGNFYGVAHYGGSNGKGVTFKMTPSGTFTLVHHFAGGSTDGAYPWDTQIQGTDGNLYGETSNGGASDEGAAYKISLSGTFSFLHSFPSASEGYDMAKAFIQALDGNFIGVTAFNPTIFSMTSSGVVTVLAPFPAGLVPGGSLYQSADGTLFGVSIFGGTQGSGVIYELIF